MPTRITFDITQTDYALDPNEEYTISFENGFMIDDGNTANQDLDFITFTTDPVVIDTTLLYVGSKIYGAKLTFSRDINLHTNPELKLYHEDSTLLQTWNNSNLNTTWSVIDTDEVELYITVAGELVDRTFFIVLSDDSFIADDRVVTKSDSWADSSVDLQYVGQHLEQLVLNDATNIPTSFSKTTNLTSAPFQGFTPQFSQTLDQTISTMRSSASYRADGYSSAQASQGQVAQIRIINISTGGTLYNKGNPNSSGAHPSQDVFAIAIDVTEDYFCASDYYQQTVWVWNMSDGSLEYTLQPSTSATRYGEFVKLTDDYLITSGGGKIFVYNLSDGSLAYTITEDVNGSVNGNYTLDANSTYLVAGNADYDTGSADGANQGEVNVYNSANGNFIRTITNPNDVSEGYEDRFGDCVVLDGSTLLVGSPFEDEVDAGDGLTGIDDNAANTGRVYIFDLTTGNKTGTLQIPENYFDQIDWDPITDPLDEAPGFGHRLEITADYYIVHGYFGQFAFIYDKTTLNHVMTIRTDKGNNYNVSSTYSANDDYIWRQVREQAVVSGSYTWSFDWFKKE